MLTPFQNSVYSALHQIPKGRVTTYGEIAKFLGNNAVRAVGTAVGKNPNAPVCPCHRVVPQTGKIGKYSGGEGVKTKIEILKSEGVCVENGKIVDFEQIFWGFDMKK